MWSKISDSKVLSVTYRIKSKGKSCQTRPKLFYEFRITSYIQGCGWRACSWIKISWIFYWSSRHTWFLTKRVNAMVKIDPVHKFIKVSSKLFRLSIYIYMNVWIEIGLLFIKPLIKSRRPWSILHLWKIPCSCYAKFRSLSEQGFLVFWGLI